MEFLTKAVGFAVITAASLYVIDQSAGAIVDALDRRYVKHPHRQRRKRATT